MSTLLHEIADKQFRPGKECKSKQQRYAYGLAEAFLDNALLYKMIRHRTIKMHLRLRFMN